MAEHSAGILLYRRGSNGLEVLLVHPGGPFWRRKDAGAWQIPKGKIDEGEELLEAALREFEEELGVSPTGTARPLGRVRQAAGKLVDAFALEGDLDADAIASTNFEMEWPPKSGAMRSFPEVDRAAWFTMAEAREKMLVSQRPLLDQLEEQLNG
ncbi:NUDIX domain-containing protein [Sphingomonas crusticola]|uniref:NUDIX domain-containing protein n=1 Tax=Sphingomonas crusticola TaxID=1697973 RepID=UPI000E27B41E|nr:NUDIX domain-containing protein [Sphingomonas crusticola]